MIELLGESDYDIVCGWINKRYRGLSDMQSGVACVYINIELLLVETLVHEILHIKHADWTEGKVEKLTCKCVKRIKAEHIRRIGKKLIKLYLAQAQQKTRKKKKKKR